MKYSKPGLHFLSATKASLHCTNGSVPGGSDEHVCQDGGDVSARTACAATGLSAHGTCNTGTGAGDNCVGGSTAEVPCVAGGVN